MHHSPTPLLNHHHLPPSNNDDEEEDGTSTATSTLLALLTPPPPPPPPTLWKLLKMQYPVEKLDAHIMWLLIMDSEGVATGRVVGQRWAGVRNFNSEVLKVEEGEEVWAEFTRPLAPWDMGGSEY